MGQGKRAKYQTQEERLSARRAQRAERASTPREKEARRVQNRRAWQKKRWLQLLDQDPPTVPQAVQEEAEKDISNDEHPQIFNQFLEGGDRPTGLNKVDGVERTDLEDMMGSPPYPNKIISLPEFSDSVWPMLSTALHGMLARKHLAYCDELVARSCKLSEEHIMAGLDARYHELTLEFNRKAITIRRLSEQGDWGSVAIATQNNRWIARLIVYTAQDMVALRKGSSALLQRVSERKRPVAHRGHEMFDNI